MPSRCEPGALESEPRSSRPNAAQQPAPQQLPTPERHPSPHQRQTEKTNRRRKRGGLRRSGPRAREGAQLTSTPPKTRVVPASWESRRAVRHLVPSRCEPGALESEPRSSRPNAAQQPAPQQLPTPERHPSPHRRQQTKQVGRRKRGGLRRSGPRAREGALLTSTPPKTRVVPASWESRARREAPSPSRCEPGARESEPRSSRPNAAAAGAAAAANARAPSLASPATTEQTSRPTKRGVSAPLRPSRARGGAIKVNAAQNACRSGQLGVPSRREAPSPSRCEPGGLESEPRSSRPNAAAAAGAAAAAAAILCRRQRKRPRARLSAPLRPSRARGGAIKVNAAQNACRSGQLGVPSRREAPSPSQLRAGWTRIRTP